MNNFDDRTIDRTPPAHQEAEQAVLGAILIDTTMIVSMMELLRPEDFYRESHKVIYEAMIAVAATQPIDIVTLASKLHNAQQLERVGGIGYLTELASAVPTTANASYYARIVQEKALLRRLIRTATEIVSSGYTSSEDVKTIIDDAERRILAISTFVGNEGFVPIRDVLKDVFDRVETMHEQQGMTTGIRSGFPDLDKMTSGFQRSDLIIVAARPSVGKTAFALNIVQNVAVREKKTVAVFSLEMAALQLAQRMVCAEGHIDAQRLRTGSLHADDWEKLAIAIASLSESHIYIDDSPVVTAADIRAKTRRLQKDKGLDLIVIDYLQLIAGRGRSIDNRQQEVSDISRTLKQIARELEVPVIALSQLSRGVEQRQDKRPMMSDLRESGSIEQDADVVAFLYRDDYYNPESERKNTIDIIIAKQRNGPIGTVELAFLKQYNKFVSLDKRHSQSA
jgi:replicative DNA helicase